MRSPQRTEGDFAPGRLAGVQGEQGLSRNQWAVLATLASAVAVVFCCLGGLVLASLPSMDAAQTGGSEETSMTPTAGDAVRQTPIPEETPSFVATETPTASMVPTDTATPSIVPTGTATPALTATAESTPTSRPTVDPGERWLQHWDRPGSTLDPEGWFRVAEMTWEAVDSAVRSGDRQEACGYSVRFKVEEAESALDGAPPPGRLDGAEKLLRDCIIYWKDAADWLSWECQFTSGVPETFRMSMVSGDDSLELARREIEAYKQAAGAPAP